jgi:uncharacterized protein (TIGR03435 family)
MTPLATTRLTLVTVVSLAVLVVAPSHLYGRMQGLATEPKAPAFEVASVKLNTSGDLRATMGVQPGGRFSAINVPARTIISYAYQLQEYQVVGGSAWLDSDRFDISAKAAENQPLTPPSPGGPPATIPLMVRALLAERFLLLAHPDTREMPVYHLVVARADSKLGPQIRSSTADCSGPQTPAPTGQRPACGIRLSLGSLSAGGRTLADLAGILSQFVRRPVSDATGITGVFEFDLTWTPDIPANAPPESVPPVDPDRPTLFTALQEQLGLRLQAARRPVPVLAIDRAEKPTPD